MKTDDDNHPGGDLDHRLHRLLAERAEGVSAAADLDQVMAAAERPLPSTHRSTHRSRFFYTGFVAAAVVAVLAGIGVVGLTGDGPVVQGATNQRVEPTTTTTTMTTSASPTLSSADDGDDTERALATEAVPNVVGKTLLDAQFDLRVAGFQVEVVLQENPDVEPNIVLAQDPGAEAEPGSVVTIFVSTTAVSTGQEQVEVPLLAGLNQAAAKAALADLNVTNVEVRLEASEAVPSGQVIRSEPTAGQLTSIDDTIIVFVSSAPAQVQVPLVLGLSREAAQARLTSEDLQFVVQFREHPLAPGDQDIGVVSNTDPAPDSVVPQGSTIIVLVGVEGPSETTTTTQSPDPTTTSSVRTTPSTR